MSIQERAHTLSSNYSYFTKISRVSNKYCIEELYKKGLKVIKKNIRIFFFFLEDFWYIITNYSNDFKSIIKSLMERNQMLIIEI